MFPAVDQQGTGTHWTSEQVEAHLIAAYRRLPYAPVYSTGGHLQSGILADPDPTVDTLSWPTRFVPDRPDRLMLSTWANCQANHPREYAERCRAMGWSRATAERGRRRAAERIAACLNSEQHGLDSEKNGIPPKRTDAEASPVLADP